MNSVQEKPRLFADLDARGKYRRAAAGESHCPLAVGLSEWQQRRAAVVAAARVELARLEGGAAKLRAFLAREGVTG